jgi:hypothetical protein
VLFHNGFEFFCVAIARSAYGIRYVLQALVIATILSRAKLFCGVIISLSAPPGLVENHRGITQ